MYRPRKTIDLLDEEKTSQTSGIPTSNPRTSRYLWIIVLC